MTSGSSFVNVFGGVAIRPAQPSYLALTISEDTALVWPLETTEGQPVVATQLDITATTMSLQLQMPPGSTGSTGVQTIVSNVGSDTFTVTDQAGNAITPIATTETWLIALVDNTTANGTWRAIQIGATVSEATAAALAGFGLQANGSLLQINWPTTVVSASGSVGLSARSTLLKWTGASAGTLQLGASATLGNGWVCAFTSFGDPLTFTCTGGDTINGSATLEVLPGISGFIFCTGTGFLTVGAQIGILPIYAGGTGAGSAIGALENFGGTNVGISIFTAATTTAVVALLGLAGVNITETTVSSNQSLSPSSGNTAFVCTAPLTLSLPLTTSLTDQFSFLAFAQGGAVLLTPQSTDAIQGGSAGGSVTIPEGSSVFVFTDADGNWWIFFLSLPITGGTLQGALTIESGGLVVTAGGFMVEAGGANINAGGMSVAGGITISSVGLGVTGSTDLNGPVVLTSGATITGAVTISAPGTAGNEATNFSQFPATLAVPGAQTLPSGYIEQWGTGSIISGSGTVTFASAFPNNCFNVQLTIIGGTVATTQYALVLGTLSASGFPVYGDASESVSFSYRAIGN